MQDHVAINVVVFHAQPGTGNRPWKHVQLSFALQQFVDTIDLEYLQASRAADNKVTAGHVAMHVVAIDS